MLVILTLTLIFLFIVLFDTVQRNWFTYVTYTLKKNRHYSKPILPFFYGWNITRLTTIIEFDKSCLYNESELEYSGVNKLTGITNLFIHNDSYRWGWRSNGSHIDLYAYIYDDGQRFYKKITSVLPNRKYELTIIKWIDKVQYIINDNVFYTNTGLNLKNDSAITYINRPYFGGRSKSPHDMNITIDFDIM